ncbi:hypothetical protein D3C77_514100 [compost metagenome]
MPVFDPVAHGFLVQALPAYRLHCRKGGRGFQAEHGTIISMPWYIRGTDVEQHDAAHVVLIDEAACCWRRALNDVGAVVRKRVCGVGAAEAVAAFLIAFQIHDVEVLRDNSHRAQGWQFAANRSDSGFLDQFKSFFAEGHALFLIGTVSYERG